jgi:hypothetical protein
MNNKYARGKYIIHIFDEFGSKMKTVHGVTTCTEAADIGASSDGDSYVVMRIVMNSKTTKAST